MPSPSGCVGLWTSGPATSLIPFERTCAAQASSSSREPHLEGDVVQADLGRSHVAFFGREARFLGVCDEGNFMMPLAAAHEANTPRAVGVVARFVAIRNLESHDVAVERHRFAQVMDLEAHVLDASQRRRSFAHDASFSE